MKKAPITHLSHEKLLSAAYMNSFRTLDPFAPNTGLRTKELLLRDSCLRSAETVAELFLANSRFLRDDRETELSIRSYFTDEAIVTLSLHSAVESGQSNEVSLPKSAAMRMRLDETLIRRRSVRAFTGDPVDLVNLASIVRAATGITSEMQVKLATLNEPTRSYHLRPAPSAGGLYPIELIVAASNISDLEQGLYTYDVQRDKLRSYALPNEKNVADFYKCFGMDEADINLTRAGCTLLLIGYPWRAMRKYGNRGLRFVLQEAGAIAQNVHLACVALGLGSVDCATIYDDEAHSVLGMDGNSATLLHTVIIGHPA